MSRIIGIGVLALAVAGGAGWWLYGPEIREKLAPTAAASAPGAPQQGSQQAPIAVEIRQVTLGRVRDQIEAVGSLRSNESVILRPEIAGRISEILFEEGQPVKRGTPLVRLDAAIARAQVNQAKASIALSRANHSRAEELYGKGAGTQRARDETIAKLSADEAALALAQATLDKSTLLAPFDGVLGLRQVSVGDYVNPGQALVNVESLDQLKVDFRIPEVHSQLVAVNQAIRVRLDAIPGKTFDGKVYAIDPAFDPNGRAAILRARLPNPERQLNPGMFARVTLIVEERNNAILVPETALVPSGRDIYAFRVADGRAVQTKLRIGLRRDGQVEILEGLDRDDKIVTEGVQKLRNGQYVRPATAPAPVVKGS
ncbi:efflux RND transporter periplasmic adaptor subunit [Ferrovibrio sp.]|uniref:efflux RND transporter periplasmic adaptor subunit n=1 Tax=Ferrovibrio sp. TaxID=1917215 RepID=UPI0025BCEE18|nr:efflux RND transporter periplasmic adaptor subunit [Ferrovibrio sp.]MBX3453960.1 efflux RND transporter periplasmic adaptor subunit [Ferrovibrio sp.]